MIEDQWIPTTHKLRRGFKLTKKSICISGGRGGIQLGGYDYIKEDTREAEINNKAEGTIMVEAADA
jgi:hypothetical protein